jgi:hypothetical protein
MRLAADSITSADIPTGRYALVAGYLDGAFAWSEQDWLRHTSQGAIAVGIVINPANNAGEVLDVETGDATPRQAVDWVRMRRAAGFSDLTVYCAESALPYVQQQFSAAGAAQPNYWVAGYDDVATIPAGCIAKQYANSPMTGGHYDLSIVADYWPGVDHPQEGFLAGPLTDQQIVDMYNRVMYVDRVLANGGYVNDPDRNSPTLLSEMSTGGAATYQALAAVKAQLDAVKAEVDALKASSGGDPATLAVVSRIEKAMQAA